MVSDLNNDGVGDILVGYGVEGERGGMTALDGNTGELLWTAEARDEVYSTTPLVDLNGDGVIDPVMGGRSLNEGVTALNGKNGSKIWTLKKANIGLGLAKTNFNTPVRLPDQNGDGIDDLLVAQSGGQDETRPPARMHLVSGKDGKILWSKLLPDRLESYSVPSVLIKDGQVESLVVGSGGETLSGHVFRLDFPEMTERWRFFSEGKGVVGSPVVHRFSDSNREDVIVTCFNGKTYRLNGLTGEVLWEEGGEGFETYVSPALGRLNGEAGLDVVTLVSLGVWPNYQTKSLMKWIDGKSGEVIHEETVGVFSSSSPIVAELTGDDFDEIIILSNPIKGPGYDTSYSNLLIFDGRTRERLVDRVYRGLAAGTPHLSDIDLNGKLDLVHSRWGVVERSEISTSMNSTVTWGQFRGPNRDGVFDETP